MPSILDILLFDVENELNRSKNPCFHILHKYNDARFVSNFNKIACKYILKHTSVANSKCSQNRPSPRPNIPDIVIPDFLVDFEPHIPIIF